MVGHKHISQCISALENWWFNHQHEAAYKACPEACQMLCDDSCIKTYEEKIVQIMYLKLMCARLQAQLQVSPDALTDDSYVNTFR